MTASLGSGPAPSMSQEGPGVQELKVLQVSSKGEDTRDVHQLTLQSAERKMFWRVLLVNMLLMFVNYVDR
jgi:hypothetical protein